MTQSRNENTPLTRLLFSVLVLLALAPAAHAQIMSIPPQLQGQASFHLWSITGFLSSGGVTTVVTCTNANTVPVRIGVQVFDNTGAAVNDPSATSLSVGPGGTVAFGAGSLAAIFIDSNLMLSSLPRGAARVLATASKGIICGALIADAISGPPTSMASLTIVKKTKQAGD